MPSWKELERFLKNDGWRHIPSKSGRDNWYEKKLSTGERLQSRVSKSSGEIGTHQFKAILKHQLQCNVMYFNSVKNKKPKSEERFPK